MFYTFESTCTFESNFESTFVPPNEGTSVPRYPDSLSYLRYTCTFEGTTLYFRKYESTCKLSYFRTFVLPYFRTSVLSYFRTFVRKYFRTSVHVRVRVRCTVRVQPKCYLCSFCCAYYAYCSCLLCLAAYRAYCAYSAIHSYTLHIRESYILPEVLPYVLSYFRTSYPYCTK